MMSYSQLLSSAQCSDTCWRHRWTWQHLSMWGHSGHILGTPSPLCTLVTHSRVVWLISSSMALPWRPLICFHPSPATITPQQVTSSPLASHTGMAKTCGSKKAGEALGRQCLNDFIFIFFPFINGHSTEIIKKNRQYHYSARSIGKDYFYSLFFIIIFKVLAIE